MNKKLLATLFASSVLLTACSSEKSENNTSSSTSSQNTESNKSTENQKEAFDFLAKNVDGEDVKLSDFKGKKFTLTFGLRGVDLVFVKFQN